MMTFSSTTYLKDVNKYKISMIINNNIGICIKKILEINEPFLLNEEGKIIKIIDNNYYVVEIVPFDKNYVLRVYLDYDCNVIERYYFITNNNCVKEGVIAYRDLKLAYVCTNNNKKIYNQDKLKKLVKDMKITPEKYKKANEELQVLINEINDKTNDLYNMNYKKLIVDGGI